MASTSVEIEQILQICLEEIQTGRETIESILVQQAVLRGQLRPELEAASWFWQRSGVFDPRPGFISASRDRLVDRIKCEAQTFEQQGQGSFSFSNSICNLKRNLSPLLRIAAVMTLVVFAVFGTIGVAQASLNALPGESLYRVKTGLEDTALALSFSNVNNANLHIKFARRRLLEMQMLTLEGRFNEIDPVARSFEYHLDQALQVMNELPDKDPGNLKMLVKSMQDAVTGQTHFIDFLSNSVPADTKLVFDRVSRISVDGLSTANNLLTLDLGGPTPLNPPERVVSTAVPTVVVDLVVTIASAAPPTRLSDSDLSPLSVSTTPIQTASVIPPAVSTIAVPVDLTSISTQMPAFSYSPEISPTAFVPAVSTTPLIKEDDQPARKTKPTRPSKPVKEPKPTKIPKDKEK